MQHVISVRPECITEMKDDVDAINAESDTEIEELRKTIKGLSPSGVNRKSNRKIKNMLRPDF